MNTFRWRSLNPFPPSPASPSSHHSLADGISGKENGNFVSFTCPYLDLNRMKTRLVSDDEHFKMLQKIDARWTCSFSNYGWTPEVGDSHNFREMKPIYAREWVVIVTNYTYMMTTPEYKYVMANFKKVMGGDLYDNNKVTFTAEKYQSEMERFKAQKTSCSDSLVRHMVDWAAATSGPLPTGTSMAIMVRSADGKLSPTSICTAWTIVTTAI